MKYTLEHKTKKTVSAGSFHPLGATLTADGVNFAVFSQHAAEVYLLLFDRPDGPPTDIIRLPERERYIWHGHVQGVKAGQLYAFKVRGEWKPSWGWRFNEHKLLVDPYAKAFSGKFDNRDNLLLPYDAQAPGPNRDMVRDERDNTECVPRCIVIDDRFDWQGDVRPNLPLDKLLVYEVHVKGFTAHKSAGVKQAGTYLGFIDKIPYLKSLGINAVELLPIHEYYVEDFLQARGLTNYWGYNTVGFFAPESSYGTGSTPGCQVAEFKQLVRALHAAGIEVILDVVYNHTAEGNECGPALCFKGLDNPSYYCLTGTPHDPWRYYMNYTGCGNSLNLGNTAVLRLVMDSLRYWVQEMHVDGFRFDLASVLGREDGLFYKSASFFDAIMQDPVLSTVKMIAEPWDLGTYQVGNFPIDWSEWNGRFRDTLRRFAKGDGGLLGEVACRMTGSADLYGDDGRSAYNSVNFITCHDGFTLHDLVAYNWKHNEANLENNNDGSNDNNSWNCGAEGPTTDAGILALRRQLAKNHLCHLLFALGTPMLLGGDEFLRTQGGSNNAYCQDNEINWYDWDAVRQNADMVEFVRRVIAFRRRYSILENRRFLTGADVNANAIRDITWYGRHLDQPAWDDPGARTLCYQLDGGDAEERSGRYLLFFILNTDHREQYVHLPQHEGYRWYRVVDTSQPAGSDFAAEGKEILLAPQDHYIANGRSTVVLLGRG